jgi:hypothetical protein
MFAAKRTKLSRILLWYVLLFVLMGVYLAVRPYIETVRVEKIARELGSRYGLIIRYGDPSEFHVPPLPPADSKVAEIQRVDKRYVLPVLEAVKAALQMYPPDLIKKHVSAIFVTGPTEVYGAGGAGMRLNSWIYLSAPTNRSEQLGSQSYAMVFHHELSSFFFYDDSFPVAQWASVNEPDFKYLERRIDIIRAAAPENRRDPKEAPSWYQAGFVHDYGMSSMENDFNTYAELAMAQPAELIQLAKQYPKIAQKTKIFVEFYSSLAPELREYFKSVGLAEVVKDVELPSIIIFKVPPVVVETK